MENDFFYGIDSMTPGIALGIETGAVSGRLDSRAREKVDACYRAVAGIVEKKKIVYGINTGFGSLCTTIISKEETQKLQTNILRSHSVGVGDHVPEHITRLMLILKVHALSRGFSGIAVTTLERMLWHIENRVTPVVPCKGSVGASGDLAPLAHLFLPLIGQGFVRYKGRIVETAQMFQQEGLEQVRLGPKEGLALINGTQFMTAFGVTALERMNLSLDSADIISAMTLEALLGSAKPFIPELHQLRPYAGQQHVAHRMQVMLHGSEMVASHADCGRVQDPYSLRCIPQVHGACRNAWLHLHDIFSVEVNAVTDNPVVFNENTTVSGGNFHGEPIAIPMDYASIAASELGNISDRRTYLMLKGGYGGLPVLLMQHTGINSGFMIPQYTSAALVSENKSLCFPASCDSIPTSLGQEDHVSMGSISSRKLNTILDNLENILAVELVCAAQAFDFRRPMKSGPVLEACHNLVRSRIDHAEEDRIFSRDLADARDIIVSGNLRQVSESAAAKAGVDLQGGHADMFAMNV